MIDRKALMEKCYISLVSQNCDFFSGEDDTIIEICLKLKQIAEIAADIFLEDTETEM